MLSSPKTVLICIVLMLSTSFSCKENGQQHDAIASQNNLFLNNDMLFSELQVNEVKLQVRFDTGCLLGCILSDSDARSLSTVMYQSERDSRTKYLLVDSISIAGTAYGTDTIYTSVSRSRSILAPHYTDEDRIWHIDLDAGMMRIDTDESVPEKALIYALDFAYKQNKKLAPMVHLPIDFTFGSDTLKTDYYYLLDTGTPYGVAITDPPSELLQFVSSISHSVYEDTWSVHNPSRLVFQFQPDVHLGNQSLQGVYCLVDTKVRSVEDEFGKIFNHPGRAIVGTLGMGILKHFNFTLDFKNSRLILIPNHTVFPDNPSFRRDFLCDKSGRVKKIRRDGDAWHKGLRVGDEIKAINGIPFSGMPFEFADSLLHCGQTLTLELANHNIIHLAE